MRHFDEFSGGGAGGPDTSEGAIAEKVLSSAWHRHHPQNKFYDEDHREGLFSRGESKGWIVTFVIAGMLQLS
jgi:hypothetical protein